MAKVKTNPAIEQIRGKIGELVFKRYGQEVIVTRSPNLSGKDPTDAQKAAREDFRLATVYGKAVMADAAAKTAYAAKAKEKHTPVFALAVADFFYAPAVDEIDLSEYTGKAGETIHIRASDDFEVAGVGVVIHDASGAVLEQGPATATNGTWNYQAKTALPANQTVSIDVTATDRPGNKTTKTQTKS